MKKMKEITAIRKNERVVWEKYIGRRTPYDWREITVDLLSWEKYVERRTPYDLGEITLDLLSWIVSS